MSTIELAVRRLAVVSTTDSAAHAAAAIKRVSGFKPRALAVSLPAVAEPAAEVRGIATPAWAGPIKVQSANDARSITIAALAALAGAGLMWGAIHFQGKSGAGGERVRPGATLALAGATSASVRAAPAIRDTPPRASESRADRAPSQATSEPRIAPPPSEDSASGRAEATIDAWARAWSERDAERYLSFYAAGFLPDRGMSRAAWENNRRKRLQAPRNITIAIRDLHLQPVGENRIIARFAQDYAADSYRETGTRKMMLLVREAGGWRIAAETVDPTAPGPG